VSEGLARELDKLNLCAPDYIIAACSIHGPQLQLTNAAKRAIGEGGLGKRNAMQMLHSVCDLQESIGIEEWRHALMRANEHCVGFVDDKADNKHFAAACMMIEACYDFEVTPIDPEAYIAGTMLAMIQAPVLTRWWTVGVGASYSFKCYLQVLRVCQILINRCKSDSRTNTIASGLYALMTDPNSLADLVSMKCFHCSFIRKHLD